MVPLLKEDHIWMEEAVEGWMKSDRSIVLMCIKPDFIRCFPELQNLHKHIWEDWARLIDYIMQFF